MDLSIEVRHVGGDNPRIECDWGVLKDAGAAHPERGFEPLILIDGNRLRRLLSDGPLERNWGGVSSASRDGDKTFLHIDFDGQRATWELFPCHFVGVFEERTGWSIGKFPEAVAQAGAPNGAV